MLVGGVDGGPAVAAGSTVCGGGPPGEQAASAINAIAASQTERPWNKLCLLREMSPSSMRVGEVAAPPAEIDCIVREIPEFDNRDRLREAIIRPADP